MTLSKGAVSVSRNEILLKSLNRSGNGLEIGPCHRPAAPKREGFRVDIVDHLTREQLIEKYRNSDLELGTIEDVDYLWSGQDYVEVTGKSKHYDWVIASHVIEHTPDLVGFLLNCDSVLKDDGVLSLAVPDKRYCFDHFRPISGIGNIIDSHLSKNKINSPGTVAEYFLNVVKKDGKIAWDSQTEGSYEQIHNLAQAKNNMKRIMKYQLFMDCHSWCFVPHSFRLLIQDLFDLELIPFREVSFTNTIGTEFFITLGRNGSGLNLSRTEVSEIIEDELSSDSENFVASHELIA